MPCKSHNCWLAVAVLLFTASAGQAQVQTAAAGGEASPQPTAKMDPRRALFEQHRKLEERLVALMADSSDAVRAFGQLLPAADRRRLQAACSSLARNPDNTGARDRLQTFIDNHRDQGPRVIARYCFNPGLHQLLQEVRATRRALQQRPTSGGAGEFDVRFQMLEQAAGEERRRYAAIRDTISVD